MPIIALNPQTKPNDYYQQSNMDPKNPGVGLQILFKVDGEYYIIAGSRYNKVYTLNGGSVESKKNPFFAQLQEELAEETFGVLKLAETKDGYQLLIQNNDNQVTSHPLIFKTDQSYQLHTPFIYTTFTAICETVTLKELSEIADRLTPTAVFWNNIGNYLFKHLSYFNEQKRTLKLNEEQFYHYCAKEFTLYWNAQHGDLQTKITEWKEAYIALSSKGGLLTGLSQVFGTDEVEVKVEAEAEAEVKVEVKVKVETEAALNKLLTLSDYNALKDMMTRNVGRFSERPGYHVFSASYLLQAAEEKSEVVCDIKGQKIGKGILNADAVLAVFPALNIVSAKQAKVVDFATSSASHYPLFNSSKNEKEEATNQSLSSITPALRGVL